jgi:hypothetical protein
MSVERETSASKPQDAVPRKRAYSAPRLTEYGSVAKLTQGTLTLQNDGSAGNSWKKASCL